MQLTRLAHTTLNEEVVMKTLAKVAATIIITLTAVSLSWAQTEVITILHLNDTHSNLASIGPRDASLEGSLGGAARAASWIKMFRLTEPNVMLLHAGDSFIGDLFFNTTYGAGELQVMLALGFDAMAVGNHEFDLTPDVLLQALGASFAEASFPLLSANLVLQDSAVQPLKRFISPYTMKQYRQTKVGIFGLTTPATNILSSPAPAYVDSNIVQIAAGMVDTLTSKGCNVVICLSHLGIALDQLLASYVPGIHVIVGGHDHITTSRPIEVTNPVGNKTWIVQANAFYLNIGKMTLSVTGTDVKLRDYQMIKIDQSLPVDAEVAAVVSSLISGIEGTYGPLFTQQIGYAAKDFDEVVQDLHTPGKKETPIGNLVTDAFRAVTGTDVAIEVGGSTAQAIYHGPIVGADLFRVVGYGFNTDNGLGYRLATFKMTGAALWAGLEFGLGMVSSDNNDEFLLQVSGVKYTYRSDLKIPDSYTYRLGSVTIGNAPLDPAKTYTVTANEFVPLFLNAFGIPFDGLHVFKDTTEFQVLMAYVAQLGTISPVVEGRIIADKVTAVTEDVASVPTQFMLAQNYPNPFNPSTTITFGLPHASFVSLKVYNLLGQEVAVLVNEQLAAGKHTRMFVANNLASGVYLYKLTAGDASTGSAHSFVQTRRMLLTK